VTVACSEGLPGSACAAHPPLVRNETAHAVSGHEAESEYRRHELNELDQRNLPKSDTLIVMLQRDKSETIGL
jgi:hypothetical protein